MPTTTNYGWTTPADTDLVKDGASAIRTLGSAIDTTTKNLNPSTTLGDIEYRSSTANTNTRLGIGTTGQVLTVSGGVPSWATPATGKNFVALNGSGTTLSGSSTSVTGLSGYDAYYVFIYDATSSDAASFTMTLNSDTTSKYGGSALQFNQSATAANIVGSNSVDVNSASNLVLGANTDATKKLYSTLYITGGNASGAKIINKISSFNYNSGNYVNLDTQIYTGSSVISSIQVACTSGSFNNGKIYIYGSV